MVGLDFFFKRKSVLNMEMELRIENSRNKLFYFWIINGPPSETVELISLFLCFSIQ